MFNATRRGGPARLRGAAPAAWALAGLLGTGPAWADHIHLVGGGSIDGVVLPAPEGAPEGTALEVLTPRSPRPMRLRREQVERVEPGDDAISRYPARAAKAGPAAADQLDLARWCGEQGLPGPAQRHYQAVVALEPENAEARQALGHVQHGGRWMTRDEQRRAQGLVEFRGRWVSPAQKEELERRGSLAKVRDAWTSRARVLRAMLHGPDPSKRAEAEETLSAVREPGAVAPLVKALGSDGPDVRLLLARTIAAIEGSEAREALVRMLLAEPEPQIRQVLLHELETRGEPELAPRLIKALDARDVLAVGRAAWALAQLEAREAVPKLTRVLVRSETRMVVDPMTRSAPNIGVGFGGVVGVENGPAGGFAVPGASGGVPATPGVPLNGGLGYDPAAPGFNTIYGAPVLTGPAVGPGVVAFGATSVPVTEGVMLGNGNPNRPSGQVVTMTYENEEVLRALESLTGVSFGYDVPAWRRWVASQFRVEEAPPRRVRQP